MRSIAHDAFVNLEFYSTIAYKYRIKKALVSWIVRNYKKNPSLIDEIELRELNASNDRLRVTSAAE